MGWNDRGGTFPASERRVYVAKCAVLELAAKHDREAARIRQHEQDEHAAQVHDQRCLQLLRDVGIENLEIKVDG